MPRNLDWRNAKMIRASELREPQPTAVTTGCGSYLIQPRFFDESLREYSQAPQGAFYMDNIWISGCLTRRNVKRYVVAASAMMRSVFRQRRTLSPHCVREGRQYHNNETIAFLGRLGTSSLRTKGARPCDGYGVATTEHRRLSGKLWRW